MKFSTLYLYSVPLLSIRANLYVKKLISSLIVVERFTLEAVKFFVSPLG